MGAKAKAKIEFEPEFFFARQNSNIAGQEQASNNSVLLDDSKVKQKQKFKEYDEGNQEITQTEVQEDVADA